MNYYAARQRSVNGQPGAWDYTVRNDDRIRPVGYCQGWREFTEETIHMVYGGRESPAFKRDEEQRNKFRDKYHSDGHGSKEEASACYRAYLLDNRLRLDGRYSGAQYPCEICKAFTQRFAEVDHTPYTLCDEHCNRDNVDKLFDSVGETVSSW